jgi:5'-phosphate synthase pdxT subunit
MDASSPPRVGVLALQGAFHEHSEILKSLGASTIEVRTPQQLESVEEPLDGLVIPGGESTAFAIIARRLNMFDALKRWVSSGRPTWGTCAGLIILADRIETSSQKKGGQGLVGGLDVEASRNFFGAQVRSFEASVEAPPRKSRETKGKDDVAGNNAFPGVFIRAPAILSLGPAVQQLASVANIDGRGDGREHVCVAARQGAILATAFHPELTDDVRWHEFFLEMIADHARAPAKAESDLGCHEAKEGASPGRKRGGPNVPESPGKRLKIG